MSANSKRRMLVTKVVGQVLFLYGLLAWLDGVAVQLTNPSWLPMPVAHILNVRTDTFTIFMFIVSAFGFLLWRIAAELIKSEQNKAAH
jgi:uncharacterized protein with PQ loop repeat